MKKLFGRDKTKVTKPKDQPEDHHPSISTPIHQQHALYHHSTPSLQNQRDSRHPASDEDRWEVVGGDDQPRAPGLSPSRNSSFSSLPPGASPPIPAPRSPSPFTAAGKKKQSPLTPALGILRALDPHSLDSTAHNNDSSVSDHGHPDRRNRFWAKDKHQESLKDDDPPSITRMIGFLTATASEDWSMVLEVCERSSASDTNAKEAVRALRREFKYGEPSAQLSAARLWAIMLRNSTETFISQSTSKKFLDTLDDVIMSPRTSPVVRERVMDVVAAAAYASGTRKDTGFRALWRKVKPPEKPDEGIPFDTDDAMFSPPVNNRLSHYENPVSPQDPALRTTHNHRKRKSPTRNRIIPPEEDIKRLFQECKIGQGNASLLSQALALARPEDLREKDVIQEFYLKCRQSQEIIYAQIPWATAGAERSRAEQQRKRTLSDNSLLEDAPVTVTTEERLLAALLGANAEIADALQQYDDLERVGLEREAEENSRRDVRMDPRQKQLLLEQQELLSAMGDVHIGGSSSRSPSPAHSSRSRPVSLLHSDVSAAQTLAPPPAPHGPRSPTQASVHSRTSSPNVELTIATLTNGSDSYSSSSDDSVETPIKPSAKALGKRRVIEAEEADNPFDPDDLFYENRDEFPVEERNDSDSDDSRDVRWHNAHPVHFVYDAAAERTRQRLEKGHSLVVNGVH
ncbi:hypothetical protein ARMSODRAFT_954590 [Armillaria solidipes]|uniref:VHS domain-containing protein n=1 Tax=Armillaria solidipes TaxID=1076256 RepID=A0A2H3BLK8_9AGAR|nr:hypothetical protein ARMSODRAFT_954590 [Armillaria solidipes]